MNAKEQQLSDLLEALRPIIYVNDFDFHAVDELIQNAIPEEKIVEYSNGYGEVNPKSKLPVREFINNEKKESKLLLMDFLDKFITGCDCGKRCVLVLKDVHREIEEPEIIARLRFIAERTMYFVPDPDPKKNEKPYWVPVIIVSTVLNIPKELDKLITVFDNDYPNREEIESLIGEYTKTYSFNVPKSTMAELTLAFKGLSEFEIRQILNLAYQNDGAIDKDDLPLIRKEKEQAIKKGGLLEAIESQADRNAVGGLENLIRYLGSKAAIFRNLSDAIDFGVDVPKGILIVGLPGCGKSLSAKACATMFKAPLLRLDVGRLMGKYVGESEENMRRAIRQAESATPCILWIDEIEKAFAGVGKAGDGGTTTRLFGHFLTWMQEKESAVYVVATANDITGIPPEFLRKGRFDEIFSVGLPNNLERRSIFEIHLKKRKQDLRKLDLDELVRKTAGDGAPQFSGADIESIVKSAVENAFVRRQLAKINKKDEWDKEFVTQKDLLDAIAVTIPIRKTMAEKIEALDKSIKKFQIKSAS
jgi:SpoVK/Ycf46/Vps4 family AAA+-type ATPase